MAEHENRDRSTLKSSVSPQVDVDPEKVHGIQPQRSAHSTDNAAVALGMTATPSVSTLVDIYDSGTVDPVYQAKSHAISCAIQEIGMGRYQVRCLCHARKTASALD